MCGTSVLSDYGFTHILNRSKLRRILSRDMRGRSYWIPSSKTPGPETVYDLTRFDALTQSNSEKLVVALWT
jgi:hypothetical protein